MSDRLPNSVPSPDALLAMFRSDPANARLALFAGAELEKAGRHEEAVAAWTIADDVDPTIRRIKDNPQEHEMAREHSAMADAAIRRFLTALHQQSLAAFKAEGKGDPGRVGDAIWCMTHDADVRFATAFQEPEVFYIPGLAALPVTPTDKLLWAEELQSAWQDIRGEFEAAAGDQSLMVPYVPAQTPMPAWGKLRGTLDWSAIYLFKEGRPTAAERHFPKTLAALDTADLVRIDGVPMEAFFSRLVPGAHIPPHHGLTNARLTVHLPLIVPENCAIRVGAEEYHWQPGQILAFDDSFEHEAWNRSGSDRVVLIFETHHPDLTPAERAAIEHVYAERARWLARRTVTLGWHKW